IMNSLSDGRVAIGAQAVGFAQGAFDLAVAYAQERTAFGKRIIDHQAPAFRLADMALKIDIARTYVMRVAGMIDRGEPCAAEASMAKLYAGEISEQVCSEAIQIFGGYGYVEETGVARHYRDTRVCQIYEGTNDMQRLVIARSLGHVA
ncbi:MAG: acyl-CoA dehydrogenase family protein, partial [Pseudomonadota bacterium]